MLCFFGRSFSLSFFMVPSYVMFLFNQTMACAGPTQADKENIRCYRIKEPIPRIPFHIQILRIPFQFKCLLELNIIMQRTQQSELNEVLSNTNTHILKAKKSADSAFCMHCNLPFWQTLSVTDVSRSCDTLSGKFY